MKIIDTHAHLEEIENLEQALKEAEHAGVEGIVAMSMDLASCRKTLEIKKDHPRPQIHAAMGMHPSEVNLNDLTAIVQMIGEHSQELVAIGEIGLDFWYKSVKKDKAKKNEQRKVFATFLDLAKELNLPVVIHSRGAWRECFEMTKSSGVKKANFHWYSGPLDVLSDIMKSGYFVSTSPSLAYSPQSREAVSQANIEQLLIETDSPVYYQISPDEGFKSGPKDVFRTLEAYCALKNMQPDQAAAIFNRNAKNFFELK